MPRIQQQHGGGAVQQLGARIPVELYERLQIHAAKRGASLSKVITEALEKELRRRRL